MRTALPAGILLATILIAGVAPGAADERRPGKGEDDQIRDEVTRTPQPLIRITAKRFHVQWEGAALCRRPNVAPHSPHGEHWIHVFANASATNALLTGKGIYPVGSMLLKAKFPAPEGNVVEFWTGMRKREAGYNPEMGDWEFFLLDSGRQNVIARGKIESCMDCHGKYAKTDYVSRRYLGQKEPVPQDATPKEPRP